MIAMNDRGFRIAYWLEVATGLALAGILVAQLFGCGTVPPTPDPVPPPVPADVFDGAVINCELPVVDAEAPTLEPAVRGCLVGTSTAACLTDLTEGYHVDAVACAVRRLGHASNRRVLAGQPGVDDTTVDESARQWINAKKVGFR